MAKANNQTVLTGASVSKFLKNVADKQQQADSLEVRKIFEQATGEKARMWGPAIVGFGFAILKYASGREVESPHAGFSPRKGNITLYIPGVREAKASALSTLGKLRVSGGCIHIKKMSDINVQALKDFIAESVRKNK